MFGSDPPGPPLNVRVEELTSGSCTLAWDAPASDGGSPVVGYYVERSTGGRGRRFVKLGRDATPRTQAAYDDLVDGTEYEYRVVAENEAGVGRPSETSGVFVAKDPYSKPGKPGAPAVKEMAKGAAAVEWAAPDSDGGAEITHYVLEVCTLLLLFCFIPQVVKIPGQRFCDAVVWIAELVRAKKSWKISLTTLF